MLLPIAALLVAHYSAKDSCSQLASFIGYLKIPDLAGQGWIGGAWFFWLAVVAVPAASVGGSFASRNLSRNWSAVGRCVPGWPANDWRRRAMLTLSATSALAVLAGIGFAIVAFYHLLAFTLLNPRHIDLTSGLSLIPPASLAHVVLMLLAILWIERSQARERLARKSLSRRQLELFGLAPRLRVAESSSDRLQFATRPPNWRIAAVLMAPAVAGIFSPLAALETSEWVNAIVTMLLVALGVLGIEAVVFAYAISGPGGLLLAPELAAQPENAKNIRLMWHASLAAGPATLLALLVAVDIYPFEPRGLLTLVLTLTIALIVAFSLWILIRHERALGARGGAGTPESASWLGVLKRDHAPLAVVTVVSLLSFLPSVRERLGGLVDILARLIG